MSKGNLIIIGASARAAAQSAIRAGYSPWCIDLFADRDLQAIAPVKRCPREQWPHGILELMKDAPPGPVLLTGAMENHISLLEGIERSRDLLTGPVGAIEELRSSRAAFRALMKGIGCGVCSNELMHVPALHWEDDIAAMMPDRWRSFLGQFAGKEATYLVKPRRGGGGRGIRIWRRGDAVRNDELVQWRVPGRSYSALFIGAAGRAKLLGITEQLIGYQAFGAESSFNHVGNLYPAAVEECVRVQFQSVGCALAKWSGINGLFGVDAVLPTVADVRQPLNNGRIHIVDINPRYPASAELLEQFHSGFKVLDQAAVAWNLDESGFEPGGRVIGKAVIHARQRCRLMEGFVDAMEGAVADIPRTDEQIEKGRPICTVFASGGNRTACFTGLRDMAAKVYTRLQPA